MHSIGAALFLDIDQVHHFADMGYKHNPWARCPQPDEFFKHAKCVCPFDREKSFDLDGWSCQPKWWAIAGKRPQFVTCGNKNMLILCVGKEYGA